MMGLRSTAEKTDELMSTYRSFSSTTNDDDGIAIDILIIKSRLTFRYR
jgi:hypothetical protein